MIADANGRSMLTKKITQIERNSSVDSLGYLDKDFILFLPETQFNNTIKQIFNEHQITEYQTDETSGMHVATTSSEDAQKNIKALSFVHTTKKVDSKYVRLLTLYPNYEIKYEELYHQIKNIVHNIALLQTVDYKEITNLMYDKVLPLIKKEPLVYLAAHEFYVKENHMQCKLINFFLQNLLFTTSLLELDTSKTFISIEKKLQVSISSILANVGLIIVLNTLEKEEVIGMLFTPQLRKTIPKLSSKILSHSIFPLSLTQGILFSKVPYAHLQKIQKRSSTLIHPSNLYEFSFIINSYLFLVGGYNKKKHSPPQAIKIIAQQANKEFNPDFIKVIVNVISTIPPGTYVSLTNKSKGMILSPNMEPENTASFQVLSTKHDNTVADLKVITVDSQEFSISSILSEEESMALHKHRKSLYQY